MIGSNGRAYSAIGVFVFALVAAAGCNNDPKSGNGVNDVRASCEIRATWNRAADKCSVCEAAVVSPRCECTDLAEFSGACMDQADARKPACDDTIDTCVAKCDRNDCNCIDACYATNAACKQASGARDGCIAEACANQCQ